MRGSSSTVFLLGLSLTSVSAISLTPLAEAQQWVVVTATVRGNDPSAVQRAAASGAAMLGAATNSSVLTSADITARVEAELSRPFEPLPRGFADRLSRAAEEVIEHIAAGRIERAMGVGSPLITEMDSIIAAIGRDETVALNDRICACIWRVRISLLAIGMRLSAKPWRVSGSFRRWNQAGNLIRLMSTACSSRSIRSSMEVTPRPCSCSTLGRLIRPGVRFV